MEWHFTYQANSEFGWVNVVEDETGKVLFSGSRRAAGYFLARHSRHNPNP